jgi:tetratricopeptide (TPR) repeat protein
MTPPQSELEPSIADHGRQAQQLLRAGQRGAARAQVARGWARLEAEDSTVVDHGDALLPLLLSRAWLQLQGAELDGALETINRGLVLAPAHPDLCFMRGCAHEALALAADRPGKRKAWFAQALADFDRALDPAAPTHDEAGFVPGVRGWAGWVRVATIFMLLGQLDHASGAFDRGLELNPDSREAQWGKAECLLLGGDVEPAMALVSSALDDRPDGWVIAALSAEAAGLVEPMATLLDRAQRSLDGGFVAPHRSERHADACALLSIYHGKPEPGSGPFGQLAALMAGRYQAVAQGGVRGADVFTIKRVLRYLLERGQTQWLVPLLDPRADRLLPGIESAVHDVITALAKDLSP